MYVLACVNVYKNVALLSVVGTINYGNEEGICMLRTLTIAVLCILIFTPAYAAGDADKEYEGFDKALVTVAQTLYFKTKYTGYDLPPAFGQVEIYFTFDSVAEGRNEGSQEGYIIFRRPF